MHRSLLLVSGLVCVALAAVGVFVPLLPSTPFLLLAAACFARSSARWHGWLLAHRVFGPILADWEAHGAIRLRVKVAATVLSGGMVAYPILFEDFPAPLKVLAGASVLAVLVFVWTRPRPPWTPGERTVPRAERAPPARAERGPLDAPEAAAAPGPSGGSGARDASEGPA